MIREEIEKTIEGILMSAVMRKGVKQMRKEIVESVLIPLAEEAFEAGERRAYVENLWDQSKLTREERDLTQNLEQWISEKFNQDKKEL